MGLMSRALNTAHPDAGSLLKRALALRSRVTADLSTDRSTPEQVVDEQLVLATAETPARDEPDGNAPAASEEKKKPSTPYSSPRRFARRRRRARFFNVSRRCLTA
ncbi:MAG: hypothetical protein ACOCW3_00185 [Spirochaetota bacterium]